MVGLPHFVQTFMVSSGQFLRTLVISRTVIECHNRTLVYYKIPTKLRLCSDCRQIFKMKYPHFHLQMIRSDYSLLFSFLIWSILQHQIKPIDGPALAHGPDFGRPCGNQYSCLHRLPKCGDPHVLLTPRLPCRHGLNLVWWQPHAAKHPLQPLLWDTDWI